MGAIHEGHLSLVRRSVAECDATVVSIFVNPTQFGPNEDLARYPRPFERDVRLLTEERTDVVFAPDAGAMYLPDASTFVEVGDVSAGLCGRYRPGHFRGVATVVLKLFNLVQPHRAYFGRKDAQQCAVIQRMVRDLDVPVEIVTCPIVRDPDGLAMSSRNAYLSPEERLRALSLRRSLLAAVEAWRAGERSAAGLRAAAMAEFGRVDGVRVQYWEVVHPETMAPLQEVGPDGALLAVAAYVGATRLIDNETLPGD
jgi:pantoate--beta-alanine ligase